MPGLLSVRSLTLRKGRGRLVSGLVFTPNRDILREPTRMANDKRRVRRKALPSLSTLRRAKIERPEIDDILKALNRGTSVIEQLQRDSEIQFKRIAQLQAEVDLLKRSLGKKPG
jgi:hypothetical protein